jgi:cell division protease FtsH
VAGYGPVKQEISEVVDFLKNPGKFKDIGARIPRGVLLVGPPGTGKTLIARAVAGEAGVPFISVTGSDFMEMFVGVGASRVRDLFELARKSAPAIIFVDEIDSIGRKRGAGVGGGHDEREQTLNQMLAEMDGFETSEGIVMMAATNRPDILDAALLRPGRFDRQIVVPLPTQDERLEILKVHFVGKKIDDDVSLDTLSRATPGMSGADLSNLVNEAALHAVRRGENSIHGEDFNSAIDRVLMGLRRPSVLMNDHEKKLTAYHEGGHAMLAYLSKNADPVHKVTILPTGMALGMTQQLPLEERYSYNKNYLLDQLMVMLAGRGAELTVFENQSTGASNDLERATDIAQSMVKEWGMSDKIGPMAWGSSSSIFLGDEMMSSKKYSDETAKLIDDEASAILKESEVRTHKVLKDFRLGLDAIAQSLIEKEEISGSEVGQLVDDAMGKECANSITSIDVDIS